MALRNRSREFINRVNMHAYANMRVRMCVFSFVRSESLRRPFAPACREDAPASNRLPKGGYRIEQRVRIQRTRTAPRPNLRSMAFFSASRSTSRGEGDSEEVPPPLLPLP